MPCKRRACVCLAAAGRGVAGLFCCCARWGVRFYPPWPGMARVILAGTCQPGGAFSFFCEKKENAWQKKESAKETPLERVFSGLFRKTEGLRPLWLPGDGSRGDFCRVRLTFFRKRDILNIRRVLPANEQLPTELQRSNRYLWKDWAVTSFCYRP